MTFYGFLRLEGMDILFNNEPLAKFFYSSPKLGGRIKG